MTEAGGLEHWFREKRRPNAGRPMGLTRRRVARWGKAGCARARPAIIRQAQWRTFGSRHHSSKSSLLYVEGVRGHTVVQGHCGRRSRSKGPPACRAAPAVRATAGAGAMTKASAKAPPSWLQQFFPGQCLGQLAVFNVFTFLFEYIRFVSCIRTVSGLVLEFWFSVVVECHCFLNVL